MTKEVPGFTFTLLMGKDDVVVRRSVIYTEMLDMNIYIVEIHGISVKDDIVHALVRGKKATEEQIEKTPPVYIRAIQTEIREWKYIHANNSGN